MSETHGAARDTVGRYRIVSRLGAGGMGEVYLATDPLLEREVAIKLLPAETAGHDEWRQRMLREARAAARLEHPNVCSIYEAGIDDGAVYLVMQYLDGTTVSDAWNGVAAPVDNILTIARGVAAALAEAHRLGIVHRDIKPQNVMLTSKGVKVLDFGLARLEGGGAAADHITQTGVISGTTSYMSPEQLRLDVLDGRSDIFSFGVMLFQLIGGKRPFDRGSVVETIAAVLHAPPPALPSRGTRGAALERLVVRMLDKSVDARPHAADVLRELDAIALLASDADTTPTMLVSSADVNAASRATQTSRTATTTSRGSSGIADPEQHKLYTRGRHLLAKRTVVHVKQSLDAFQELIDLDPECAPAYAGLADCYLLLGFLQALAPRTTFPKARAAAARAIALQEARADAHATLGYIAYLHEWQIAEAERELRRAIALDDAFATAHHWLGIVLSAAERFDESRRQLIVARELDPLAPIFATAVAFPDVYEHRIDDALRIYGEIVELQPSFAPAHYYRGLALEQGGRLDDAIAAFERANELAPVKLESYPSAIHALACAGNVDEARARLGALRDEAASRYIPPLFFAIAHLGLGEFDDACRALDEAVDARGVRLSELHLDRRFDRLPDRARFEAVLRRIGVAPRRV
jgi:serine/threonine protein kinase/Flp pilus assembly protein TadD